MLEIFCWIGLLLCFAYYILCGIIGIIEYRKENKGEDE
jgi:hypothetical protein